MEFSNQESKQLPTEFLFEQETWFIFNSTEDVCITHSCKLNHVSQKDWNYASITNSDVTLTPTDGRWQ